MRNVQYLRGLALASWIAAASAAQAQTPIAQLPQSDSITISGSVGDIFGNKFVLEDNTGKVLIESGPEWYHQIKVTRGEKLTVVGRPDGGAFDAFTLIREDGTRIEIRPERGSPPWSGRTRRFEDKRMEDLSKETILKKLQEAGYREIDDVERKKKHWEVQARNRFGERVEVHIDFAGNVYKERRD